jgi:hypothetical protein
MKRVLIRIIGRREGGLYGALTNGSSSCFDGQYLVEYDPCRDGIDPETGQLLNIHLVTTLCVFQATYYSLTQVVELVNRVDTRNPLRADGKPNRPFTVFSVELVPIAISG